MIELNNPEGDSVQEGIYIYSKNDLMHFKKLLTEIDLPEEEGKALVYDIINQLKKVLEKLDSEKDGYIVEPWGK